ncbi:MAG: GNAT family N-acetyltransferase [Hyphomicrobiaceae bacterium]|nr:GNAT family N-acetyltransferase [Hyphomicrobiaceae bacterium]
MLCQVHRYPTDLIDVVWLRDGRRLLIRPVLPQDEALTTAFFGSLPARARYERFLAPVRDLPPALVKRFTNIDYASHLALLAETFDGGRETVVAEARYARDGRDASVAEFAVSVAEDWQRRGLASRLLAKLLARAAAAGIARVVGETLAGNEGMLHLARKAGFTARPSPHAPGVVLLERAIAPAPPNLHCGDLTDPQFVAA